MSRHYLDKSTVVRASGGAFIPGFDPEAAQALSDALRANPSGPDANGIRQLPLHEENSKYRRARGRLIMDSRWS